MEAKNFDIRTRQLIESLYSQIEQQDKHYEIEIEYTNEVLKIDIQGKIFVINKQSSIEEIWLASPISGPYHFVEKNSEWIDSNGNELRQMLSDEISSIITSKVIIQ